MMDTVKMKNEYLFVYGTLQSDLNNFYAKFLRKNALVIGKGYIKGKKYQASCYLGVKKSIYKKDRVWGEIYKLKKPKKVFKLLDKYEDASKYNMKNYEYRREKYTIYLKNKYIKAWVYFHKNS